MTVSTTTVMPNQPSVPLASGFVRYKPLAGDGMKSPMMFAAFKIDQTGDGTGGNNLTYLHGDPNYMWIPVLLRAQMTNPPGAINWSITVVPSGDFSDEAFVFGGSANSIQQGINLVPPPLMMQKSDDADGSTPNGIVYSNTPNVNGANVSFMGHLYGFKIDASKHTPIDELMASVPRGYSNVLP